MGKGNTQKNKYHIGLKAKLLFLFLILAGTPIFTFTLQAQSIVKTELENQTKASIEADSKLIISSVNLWKIRNETELLRITDPSSVLASAFLKYSSDPTSENKKLVRSSLERSLFNTPTYRELVVMDAQNGEILASSNPSLEGQKGMKKGETISIAERKRISQVYYSDHLEDYTITIENPLKNDNGKTLAIVGAYLNLQSLSPILFNASPEHASGETYLLTSEGRGIIKNIDLGKEFLSDLFLNKTEAREYINHNQEEVIGYFEYLPELGVVFLDEHEKDDLFKSLKELNTKIWLISSFIFLSVALAAYFIIGQFTKPIKKLTETAQKISEGHYRLRAKTKRSDEIGILSNSFNRMANSLTNSLNDLSLKNALMEAQYNASLFGQLSLDPNGKILSWNKAFEELWGLPKSVLRKGDSLILTEHCAKQTKKSEDFIKRTTSFFKYKNKRSHDIFELKNGKIIDRHSTPLLDKNKKVVGRIFVCRDITKEIENNKTKNEFVSLATHQLQTPLTAVRWSLENLDKITKDKAKKTLISEASQSTERVILLVSDLLNVSRLDAGMIGINSKPTDISKLIEETIEEAKPVGKKKKINIKFRKPAKKIEISVDADLISEVILNLLSNAIRFSEPEKQITVSVKRKDKQIEIAVKDEGIGISKTEQKELFTKFYRTDQAGKYNTTGSGLGLYVIKKILDACNGNIRIRSTQGKGSTFTVILPPKGPINIKEGSKVLIHKGITA